MNEMFAKKTERDYETLLRTWPMHESPWGSGDVVKIPISLAERMVRNLKINLSLLEGYVGMQKEYEIHYKKNLLLYGQELSQHSKAKLLLECMNLPGHTPIIPGIVRMATDQKAKSVKMVATS